MDLIFFILSVTERIVRSLSSVPQPGGAQIKLFPVLSVTDEQCCGERGILLGKALDHVIIYYDARRVHYVSWWPQVLLRN